MPSAADGGAVYSPLCPQGPFDSIMNMIVCSVLVLASVAALGGTDGVKICRTTGTREFREVVGALPSAHTGSGARVIDAPIVSGPNALRNRLEGLDCVAFRNPDGSHVVFFARETPGDEFSRLQVQIKWNGRYLPVQVFGNALTTVVIPKTEK